MNVRGEVRLKPNLSSMTNTPQTLNGRLRMPRAKASIRRKTSPVQIGPRPQPRTTPSSQPNPPASQKARSTARSNNEVHHTEAGLHPRVFLGTAIRLGVVDVGEFARHNRIERPQVKNLARQVDKFDDDQPGECREA